MMTDPLADMLTRIRNANAIEKPIVEMPATKLKAAVAQVLKDEGFVYDYHVGKYIKDEQGHSSFVTDVNPAEPKLVLRITLKYGPDGERVIRHIQRASKPGRRLYRRSTQLPRVLDGLGIAVLSTSRGVMSNRQAKANRVGGEVLCTVW
jgi:small subunit ribosomal protein S8